MIKTINEVPVYDLEGEGITFTVKNHWNCSDKIVLMFENKEITVVANDLLAAIKNATNTAK